MCVCVNVCVLCVLVCCALSYQTLKVNPHQSVLLACLCYLLHSRRTVYSTHLCHQTCHGHARQRGVAWCQAAGIHVCVCVYVSTYMCVQLTRVNAYVCVFVCTCVCSSHI